MYRYLLIAIVAMPVKVLAADISLSGHVSLFDKNTSVDVVFTNNDKIVIQNYYRTDEGHYKHKGKHGGWVPPGLAKKGGMPPGLAKRQRLPDNVQYTLLPRELEERLAPLPSPNYVRVRVGQDFAIMDKRTHVVFDVAMGLAI